MIRPIPNQPIDFAALPVVGCCTDDQPMSYIGHRDYIHFQVEIEACDDWTKEHSGSMMTDVTVVGAAWKYNIQGCLIYSSGSGGETASLDGWSPVAGNRYAVVLHQVLLAGGSINISLGGQTVTVGQGGEDVLLFFDAVDTSPLMITVTDGTVHLTICGWTVYNATPDVTLVVVHDGQEDDYPYASNTGYFSFSPAGGTLTVMAPMSAMLVGVGDCVTFRLKEACGDDEVVLESQPFMVVDSDDCTYLPIRGCNDQDALGFTAPFLPRLRVPAMLAWPEWEYDRTTERDENGRERTVYGDRRMKMTLRVQEVNYSDHAFLSLLPIMHHVYIGDREVVVDVDDYRPIYGDVRKYIGGVDLLVRPKQELVRNVLCQDEAPGCSPLDDPICPDPQVNVLFDYPKLTVEIYGLDGFETCQVTAEQGAISTGASYSGQPLPHKMNLGNFYDVMPIKVTVTDCGPMACIWTTTILPGLIPGDAIEVFSDTGWTAEVGSTGGAWIARTTSTGATYADGTEALAADHWWIYAPGGGKVKSIAVRNGDVTDVLFHANTDVTRADLRNLPTLTDVDTSGMTGLKEVIVHTLPLVTSLDFSDNTSLNNRRIQTLSSLTTITWPTSFGGGFIQITDCPLVTTLPWSDMHALDTVYLTNVGINGITLGGITGLKRLRLSTLTLGGSLDITYNTLLTELRLGSLDLTSEPDTTYNTALKDYRVSGMAWTSMDVGHLADLENLLITNMASLTAIPDIDTNTKINRLEIVGTASVSSSSITAALQALVDNAAQNGTLVLQPGITWNNAWNSLISSLQSAGWTVTM